MFFKNCCNFLKIHFPNIYIIIISGLITLWFHYFTKIANYYLPGKGIKYNAIMLGVVTLLLYLGDESLNELYSFDHPEAVVAATREGDDNRNNNKKIVKRVNRK